jgi:uncharacterized membrane protein YheB (UPF0754 family)
LNKSLVTTLSGLTLIALGYLSPYYPDHLFSVGLFATAGAVTNWLAVHMLFERVPGLYGSGVIPARFQEIKLGIRNVIMRQFFTPDNVEAFFDAQRHSARSFFDPDTIVDVIDYDHVFSRFVEVVLGSSFGGMLAMVGGAKMLDPLREPFKEKMREEVRDILTSPRLLKALDAGMARSGLASTIIEQADSIVTRRLDELTPDMVKGIMQDMIRAHLGWLVVWGGVFGGLIGLAAAFLNRG